MDKQEPQEQEEPSLDVELVKNANAFFTIGSYAILVWMILQFFSGVTSCLNLIK